MNTLHYPPESDDPVTAEWAELERGLRLVGVEQVTIDELKNDFFRVCDRKRAASNFRRKGLKK